MINANSPKAWWASNAVSHRRWSLLVGGILIGALLVTAVTTVGESTLSRLPVLAPRVAARVDFPELALPLEWRGWRGQLQLGRMFGARVWPAELTFGEMFRSLGVRPDPSLDDMFRKRHLVPR